MFHRRPSGTAVSATWSPRWPRRAAQIACGHEVLVVGAGRGASRRRPSSRREGHAVTLLDRYGVGNLLSSSAGPTRLWRLTHPDAVRVRLARRSVEAWERLEARGRRSSTCTAGCSGASRRVARLPGAWTHCASKVVEHTEVAAATRRGLPRAPAERRRRGWQPSAGPLLAAEWLRGARRPVRGSRRSPRPSGRMSSPWSTAAAASGSLRRPGSTCDADVVVLAPGRAPGRCWRARGATCRWPRTSSRSCTTATRPTGAPRTGCRACTTGRAARAGRVHHADTRGRLQDRAGLAAARPAARRRRPHPGRRARRAYDRAGPSRPHRRPPARPRRAGLLLDDSPDGRFVIDTLPGPGWWSRAGTRGRGSSSPR